MRGRLSLRLLLVILSGALAWNGWADDRVATAGKDSAILTGVVTDERGIPVADALVTQPYSKKTVSRTDENGRFVLKLDAPSAIYSRFLAHSPDGTRMDLWELKDSSPGALNRVSNARFTLREGKTVEVEAVDATGNPVSDATVGAIHSYNVIATTDTDGDGKAVLKVPRSARISHIFATKAGTGFDYHECYLEKPYRGLLPLPEKVRLILNGAANVRVHAVDPNGNPIAGIELRPWYIHKENKKDDINFSVRHPDLALTPKTNAEGVAVFDYFPVDTKRPIPIQPSKGYFQPGLAKWNPSDDGIIEMTLLRTVVVSGVVKNPDGSPVPGVLLQAEGNGNTHNYCRKRFRTGRDGRFSVPLDPELSYLIAVTDDGYAAESIRGLIVRENRPIDDLEIQLRTGTWINGSAPPGKTVTIIEQGTPIDGAKLYHPGDDYGTDADVEQLVRWTSANEEGRYEIRLGPGTYRFRTVGMGEYRELSVKDEPEIRLDLNGD